MLQAPGEACVQVALQGGAIASPTLASFAKNSTRATLPSGSEAFAESATVAPCANQALPAGAVSETFGDLLAAGGAPSFVTSNRAVARALAPRSSVACAEKWCLPSGRPATCMR